MNAEALKRGCRFWHRWSAWADIVTAHEFKLPKSADNDGYPIVIQERRCLDCNLAQRETVRP